MPEITILKRPREEAVITQRMFFKKTARGKVIKVLRERYYLRDDISCATYIFTKEMKDESAGHGLLTAAFIGIVPGYLSRSVAGSYDNEAIAIFLLMFTFFAWVKAFKQGSAFRGTIAAVSYFYMVAAWGGYAFITNMIPLHAFVLLLMGRFTGRLYVAYSSWHAIGTLSSMQIPFIGFQPVRTSDHMAALGIFGLLQIIAFAQLVRTHVSSKQFQELLFTAVISAGLIGFFGIGDSTPCGTPATSTPRSMYIPIIVSVSEHQPTVTAWPSFFMNLHILMFLSPAGVVMCFRTLRDEHVFVIIYPVVANYCAGVMVRLMLISESPWSRCVSVAIALSSLMDTNLGTTVTEPNAGDDKSGSY